MAAAGTGLALASGVAAAAVRRGGGLWSRLPPLSAAPRRSAAHFSFQPDPAPSEYGESGAGPGSPSLCCRVRPAAAAAAAFSGEAPARPGWSGAGGTEGEGWALRSFPPPAPLPGVGVCEVCEVCEGGGRDPPVGVRGASTCSGCGWEGPGVASGPFGASAVAAGAAR